MPIARKNSRFSYYMNDKHHFERVPQRKRKRWIYKMLRTEQNPQQPPKIFTDFHDQPTNPFQYKEWTLNYHKVQNFQDPKAVMFWFHGLNGHGGNYAYITKNIGRQLGVNIYLLDLMNFGQSEGPNRGVINSFQECLDQAEKFVVFILSKYQKRPRVFLGGNSFGGTMSFHMTLRRPNFFAGVIFLAPALRDLPNLKLVKQCAKIFGYFFPTTKTIPFQYQVMNKYDCTKHHTEDAHNFLDGLIPGTLRIAMNAMEETSQLYGNFSAPYILFQGGVDKIIDPFAPIDLEKECKSVDKTTIYFKDMWHSVTLEEEIEHIVRMMISWLKRRMDD